jgi:transposase-like protein
MVKKDAVNTKGTQRGHKGDNAMARRLPPAVCERAVELYLSGKSAKAVADELGISALTVYKLVREAGHTPRPRGAHLKELRSKLTDEDKQHIIQRYKQGDSSAVIAQALGVSSVTVIRVLRQAGVPIRNRGTRSNNPGTSIGSIGQPSFPFAGIYEQAPGGLVGSVADTEAKVITAELDSGNGGDAS